MMISVRAPRAALLAITLGAAGFAMAGTLLAMSAEPTAWRPVVDPGARASVTDVGDRDDAHSPVSGQFVYVFPTQPTYRLERMPEPAQTVAMAPRPANTIARSTLDTCRIIRRKPCAIIGIPKPMSRART